MLHIVSICGFSFAQLIELETSIIAYFEANNNVDFEKSIFGTIGSSCREYFPVHTDT